MPITINDCKCGSTPWVDNQTIGWMVGCKRLGKCQFTVQDFWAKTKKKVIEAWNEANPRRNDAEQAHT